MRASDIAVDVGRAVQRDQVVGLRRQVGEACARIVAFRVLGNEAGADGEVLPHAQRAERDVALDDLAGARIDDAAAVRPSAGRAMDPVDHVVADVHRVGVGGQHLDLERVAEAGRLERLVPPRRALR